MLVQAFGAYTYDNSYAIDSAAASPDRFVSIAIVDAEDPASPATVSALAHETGFTGVRLFSIGALEHPQPTWLDHPITFELWEVCADARPPRAWSRAFPSTCRGSSASSPQFPDQPVVLDHCGFVDARRRPAVPAGRRAVPPRRAHQPAPQGHVAPARSGRRARRRLSEIVDHLVAEFGAERLVWGSDYPQTHDRPYPDLVALGREACRNLSERDRGLVLGGTALELWPELAR